MACLRRRGKIAMTQNSSGSPGKCIIVGSRIKCQNKFKLRKDVVQDDRHPSGLAVGCLSNSFNSVLLVGRN
jgi:hypothetical protein